MPRKRASAARRWASPSRLFASPLQRFQQPTNRRRATTQPKFVEPADQLDEQPGIGRCGNPGLGKRFQLRLHRRQKEPHARCRSRGNPRLKLRGVFSLVRLLVRRGDACCSAADDRTASSVRHKTRPLSRKLYRLERPIHPGPVAAVPNAPRLFDGSYSSQCIHGRRGPLFIVSQDQGNDSSLHVDYRTEQPLPDRVGTPPAPTGADAERMISSCSACAGGIRRRKSSWALRHKTDQSSTGGGSWSGPAADRTIAWVDARPESRPTEFRHAPASRTTLRLAFIGLGQPVQGPSCVNRAAGSKAETPTGRASLHVAQLPADASQKYDGQADIAAARFPLSRADPDQLQVADQLVLRPMSPDEGNIGLLQGENAAPRAERPA